MIEAWVLDRKDDNSAALPAWLNAAVQNRTEDGLLTLASRTGVVEAGPGDLVMWDGERINVYCGHRLGACPARQRVVGGGAKPLAAIRIEPARLRSASERRPRLATVMAVMVFLGALALGYAWLMIKLIGHTRLHY
jgi:hypothetical protein